MDVWFEAEESGEEFEGTPGMERSVKPSEAGKSVAQSSSAYRENPGSPDWSVTWIAGRSMGSWVGKPIDSA